MFRWFRAKPLEEEFEHRLVQLENRTALASNGYETQHLLQAGDLCARVGRTERALSFYGRALDHYLETGRWAAAEALCRRILSVAPRTVRVRGTRMWLVATRRSLDELRVAIAEYVRSGTTAAQREIIEYQLGLMGAAGTLEIQAIVSEALLGLGIEADIDRLIGSVFVERDALVPESRLLAEHEWEERMLEATLLRPEETRRRLRSAPDPTHPRYSSGAASLPRGREDGSPAEGRMSKVKASVGTEIEQTALGNA